MRTFRLSLGFNMLVVLETYNKLEMEPRQVSYVVWFAGPIYICFFFC
jgi:hypothetical protein